MAQHPIEPMGWLKTMPKAIQQAVLDRVSIREVAAGEPLYMQGEGVRGLYGLIAGVVEVSIISSAGTPGLIYLGRRGWWFGALEVFTSRPRRFHIEARTGCDLLFLAQSQVREICRLDPGNWEAFARLMCANYESLADAVAMMRNPSPDLRVARALLILYLKQFEPVEEIEATQADIASIANVSVRSAATALAALEEQGAIVRGYRTVTLTDVDKLSKIAGSEVD